MELDRGDSRNKHDSNSSAFSFRDISTEDIYNLEKKIWYNF